MLYAALQYCTVNVFTAVFSGFLKVSTEFGERTVYFPRGLMMYIIAAAVLLSIVITFMLRVLREYIGSVETTSMRREFLILIISIVLFMAVIMCVDLTYYHLEYRLYLLLLTLLFVLLIYQAMIYWLIFRESVQRRRDNDRQRTIEIQRIQYEKIAGDIESTRRMRHDMRHHYNSLNDMHDRGQPDKMKDYPFQND